MTGSETGLSLTIDGKKNRLRIARSTMRMLGETPMVQLLYHPGERIILVRGAKEQTPGGQELYVHPTRSRGNYDIYSISFVRKIRNANPEMQDGCSYRFYGKAVEQEHMVVFPMNTMEKIEND